MCGYPWKVFNAEGTASAKALKQRVSGILRNKKQVNVPGRE